MKILHIITGLDIGGAEILLLNTCKYQKKYGHQVKVVYLKTSGMLEELFRKNGIEVEKYSIEGFKIFRSFFRLIRCVKRERFDIVHTHLTHAAFIGRIAAIIGGCCGLVNTIHGPEQWIAQRNIITKILRIIDAMLNNLKNSKVIAISEYIKRYWLENSIYTKSDNIIVLYNAIDVDEIEFLSKEEVEREIKDFIEGKFTICYVGRLEEVKNPLMLIEVMDLLVNKWGYTDIGMIVIGDGKLFTKMANEIRIRGLAHNVKLLGYKINPYKYIRLSQLFVLVSKREGLSNVVLEAMFLQKPICAPDLPPLREILNEKISVLFEPENVLDMANKIVTVYRKKVEFDFNGNEFKYDMNSYILSLNHIYNSVSKRRTTDANNY